jgi:hypothetical protein
MKELDNILFDLYQKRIKDVSKKNKISMDEAVGLKKVAFDIYKIMNDQYNDLWRVEDGFLVRSSDPKYQVKEGGDWSAVSSYDGKIVTLAYKNVPVCNFSSEEYGFSTEDVFTFKSALLDEVSQNNDFLKNVFSSQARSKKEALTNVFPELKKFV